MFDSIVLQNTSKSRLGGDAMYQAALKEKDILDLAGRRERN